MFSRRHVSGFVPIGLLHVAVHAPPARAGDAAGGEIAATAAAPKSGVVEYVQTLGAWPPPAEPAIAGSGTIPGGDAILPGCTWTGP